MNIFDIQKSIVQDYLDYIQSFLNIKNDRIREVVEQGLSSNKLCPEPLIQFNPAYSSGESVQELCDAGILHPRMTQIFRGYNLYQHQVEAIKIGTQGSDFVVTSGTGSGKSLTFLGIIFDYLLKNENLGNGIKAVIVYPMNALINSQTEEIGKFKTNYETNTGDKFPISYAQYTGQEKQGVRERIKSELPDILLTNYMMLELIATRIQERRIRDSIYQSLRFLVFDEMHTYRGRQGSDVALLIRRLKSMATNKVVCMGTSATMVSEGSEHEQKEKVAEVASKFFGKPFKKEQIVGEYLDRSLSGSIPGKDELKEVMASEINPDATEAQLKAHPLARWLEGRIALIENDGILKRNEPLPLSAITKRLFEESGVEESRCKHQILLLIQWLAKVNLKISDKRKSYLPFKLHQFISQTGSVYMSLEQSDDTIITLEPGVYKVDGNAKKPLYPIVFSRNSGHEFICVTKNYDTNKLEPRELQDRGDEDEDKKVGYIIVGDDVWNLNEDLSLLPDAWVRADKAGNLKIEKKYRDRVPQKIHFDEFGNFSDDNSMKFEGWFMPAKLLFDPTSGSFFDPHTNERTKLTKLGIEGRSTSTTVLSFNIIKQLAQNGFTESDQKLLSFTDNRQDASLQAGHFNDFIEVIQLRSAIYHALHSASGNRLDHSNLSQAIFDTLGLPILSYANTDQEPAFPSVIQDYENALKDYLMFRALYDLRRGWRVILPNLEQCALLEIDYANLTKNCSYEQAWQGLPLLSNLAPDERIKVVYQVLDYFRKSYALFSEVYLTPKMIAEKRKIIDEKLKSPWKFEENEKTQEPCYLRYEQLRYGSNLYTASAGSNSALGKYLRAIAKEGGLELKGESYRIFVKELFELLCHAGWLKSRIVRNKNNEDTTVYQLRIDQIIWKSGNGETIIPDRVKNRSYKIVEQKPNVFFQNIYKTDFKTIKKLEAKEHTAQLTNEDRQKREGKFRDGEISCLFCSPTMELGIDIADLNVVHMRNAPPNPANYAQRSGRSGRSGQAALVFTYCSNFSPHDRHYFNRAKEMVAGVVAPPRIDIANEELLASHLNAIHLSQKGLEELNNSISDLLDETDQENLPLREDVVEKLRVAEAEKIEIRGKFKKVVSDFEIRELQKKDWFNDNWIDANIERVVQNFDKALERWRNLYKSALAQLAEAQSVINSGLYSKTSKEMRQALRNEHQAIVQRDC